MSKGQKFTKTLLTFSSVITTREFSRSLKFLYPLLNCGINFQVYQSLDVSRRKNFIIRVSMHLEMDNSKNFVPRKSTKSLMDPSKV